MEKIQEKRSAEQLTKAFILSMALVTPERAQAEGVVITFDNSEAFVSKHSEDFAKEVQSAVTYVNMPNGVLYVDKEGKPLAVVPAQMIGETNPGLGFDDVARVTEGYSKAWKEAAHELAISVNPEVKNESVQVRYNWQEIQKAISNPAEAMYENVDSLEDIIFYFGGKETRGGSGLSRIDYVQKQTKFDDVLPDELQAEIRAILGGIPAQESRFNDAVKSVVNACGIFQFMPGTVEGLGEDYQKYVVYEEYEETNEDGEIEIKKKPVDLLPIPLTVQVEMVGVHISNIFKEIHNHVKPEVLDAIKFQYQNDQDFYRYFMTPVIVNAYNTGGGRMSEAINKFFTPDRLLALQEQYEEQAGYDLFDDLSKFAFDSNEGLLEGYKEDSAQYVAGVYAFAITIHKDYGHYKNVKYTFNAAAN